ncbi:hypothetical protein D350_02401 [Enterococcus faecalis VC1B-1]|nr:hypothetical protein D350_02401 [Enterococcus faecalis VC1B-1]
MVFTFTVLESCCLEWYQNLVRMPFTAVKVLESCCLEWYQNLCRKIRAAEKVLESCCLEWYQISNEHSLHM